jgi:hypothetical protein
MNQQPSVLFVCIKNAGKSQMAAGVMRKIAGDSVQVYSAGTKPGDTLNDLSAQVLAEDGVDISGEEPKLIDPQLVRDVDVVVTLGEKLTSTRSPAPASRAGTPTSPPNAASTASNACAWSATTSPPGSPTFSPDSKGTRCKKIKITGPGQMLT